MTTLIECRQKNAIQVNSNGDFITQLDTPITLDPLDSIQIKNVFIDTISDSNTLIKLEEDTDIEIKFGYYKTYNNAVINEMASTANIDVDGRTYVMASYDSNVSAGDYYFNPIENTKQITIPSGKYEPSQLAETMTQLFNDIPGNKVDRFNPSNNTLLTTTTELIEYNINFIYGNTYNLAFVRDDGGAYIEYDKAKYNADKDNMINMFVGTNSIAFIYDEVLQKFKIDQLHKPIYTQSEGDMVIGIFEDVKSANKDLYMNNKSSGIFITDISKGQDFFTDVLGFDLSKQIITTFKRNPLGITGSIFETDLIEGTNTTGNYENLDTVVAKKGSSTLGETATADIVPTDYKDYYATTQANNPIIAENPFVNDLNASAYFLIDVEEFINNTTISENNIKTKIKGIVSRYYSVNSFTSGGIECDVPYINLSNQSQYINSLHIRILNPDGSSPIDIDEDNSIYFVINKNNLLNKYIDNKNNKKEK